MSPIHPRGARLLATLLRGFDGPGMASAAASSSFHDACMHSRNTPGSGNILPTRHHRQPHHAVVGDGREIQSGTVRRDAHRIEAHGLGAREVNGAIGATHVGDGEVDALGDLQEQAARGDRRQHLEQRLEQVEAELLGARLARDAFLPHGQQPFDRISDVRTNLNRYTGHLVAARGSVTAQRDRHQPRQRFFRQLALGFEVLAHRAAGDGDEYVVDRGSRHLAADPGNPR